MSASLLEDAETGRRSELGRDARSRENGDMWATPSAYFRQVDEEFRFTVDAAALASNAKVRRFWTPTEDGLRQEWAGERVWVNPPYSDIRPWVAKAAERSAEVAVLLLPARVGASWFHDYVWNADAHEPREGVQLRPLRGRLKFVGARRLPSWDSCLVVFRGRSA